MTKRLDIESAPFAPYRFGEIPLRNCVVMASMTRGRPSEATWISRRAIGLINVPGLFTDEQTGARRVVIDAVDATGGRIFAQLAHSGAVSHPDFFDGALPVAPSAVNPGQRSFHPRRLQGHGDAARHHPGRDRDDDR
jgi:N-ethylmaleimide reductase